jgi:MFS family permease
VLTFAGLWGVPFLVTQYGFTTTGAAALTSAMLVTWALGGMAYGPVSQRVGSRKPVFVAALAISLALWSIVVFVPGLSRAALVAVLIAVAVVSGGCVLVFPFAKESVPPRLGGTVSGIANMGMMLGGMVMQPLVGFMLDRQWTGVMAGGVRVHDFAAWQAGFALMLVWGVIALVLLAFTRETRCRQIA